MNRDAILRKIQKYAAHIEWIKTTVEPDEKGFRPWAEVQAEEIKAAEAEITKLRERLAGGEQ